MLYEVTVIYAKRPREHKHTGNAFIVEADSEEAAVARMKQHLQRRQTQPVFVGSPRNLGDVAAVTRWLSFDPQRVRQLLGEPEPEVKPKPEPRLSDRPLGEVQLAVLKSLMEHGDSFGGKSPWVWSTPSQTLRILDALVQRCLVKKEDGDRYTLSPAGAHVVRVHFPSAKPRRNQPGAYI